MLSDPETWLADVEDAVVDRLRELGGATGAGAVQGRARLRTKLVSPRARPTADRSRSTPGAEHDLRAGPDRPRPARRRLGGQPVRVGAGREMAS